MVGEETKMKGGKDILDQKIDRVQYNKDNEKGKEQIAKSIDNARQVKPTVKINLDDDTSPNFDNDMITSKTLYYNDVFKSMEYLKSKKSLLAFLHRITQFKSDNSELSNRKTLKSLSKKIAKMKDIFGITNSPFLNFTEFTSVVELPTNFPNRRIGDLASHDGELFLKTLEKQRSLLWSQIQSEAKKLIDFLIGDERHEPLFSTKLKTALVDLDKKVMIMRLLICQINIKQLGPHTAEYPIWKSKPIKNKSCSNWLSRVIFMEGHIDYMVTGFLENHKKDPSLFIEAHLDRGILSILQLKPKAEKDANPKIYDQYFASLDY
ncbi:hypothetical protein QYM36_006378 [Artemia franciscana]|uniref:Uncharacterized protein n=1 Tax=Artemia franciscana TaxID=6661 RepID=A0AA88L5G7_ARTSF|nr:hypothetical protein QYM36_006378 [Artemia franciscana]